MSRKKKIKWWREPILIAVVSGVFFVLANLVPHLFSKKRQEIIIINNTTIVETVIVEQETNYYIIPQLPEQPPPKTRMDPQPWKR